MNVTAKWDRPDFQRIVKAERRGNELAVHFSDGTEVMVDPKRLLPPGVHGANWEAMTFNPYEIIVPAASEDLEISWSTIRALTDRDYAAHLADVAGEQARQIGLRIRELRDQRGLTGKELADRAGIAAQSLSRIENGHHDVVYTTLQQILAAMGASLKDLVAMPTKPATVPTVLKRVARVGIDPEFVVDRLLPRDARNQLVHSREAAPESSLSEVVARQISRVFDWSIAAVLGSDPLKYDPKIASAALFKTPARVNQLRATAYTVYAHYLAVTILSATADTAVQPVPADPIKLRRTLMEDYGSVNFENLLRFTWDSGIPVIPLRDPGAFHGACWGVDGRKVIVVKQLTNAHSRWFVDLGHELKHVASHLNTDRTMIVEGEEIRPVFDPKSTLSDQELEANEFASDLVLGGRAEELIQDCVNLSQGSVERLKLAVQRVAATEDVPVDALANYLAWRLSLQGINWWGAANNLQVTDPPPWKIARDVLFEKVNIERISPADRELVLLAMTDSRG